MLHAMKLLLVLGIFGVTVRQTVSSQFNPASSTEDDDPMSASGTDDHDSVAEESQTNFQFLPFDEMTMDDSYSEHSIQSRKDAEELPREDISEEKGHGASEERHSMEPTQSSVSSTAVTSKSEPEDDKEKPLKGQVTTPTPAAEETAGSNSVAQALHHDLVSRVVAANQEAALRQQQGVIAGIPSPTKSTPPPSLHSLQARYAHTAVPNILNTIISPSPSPLLAQNPTDGQYYSLTPIQPPHIHDAQVNDFQLAQLQQLREERLEELQRHILQQQYLQQQQLLQQRLQQEQLQQQKIQLEELQQQKLQLEQLHQKVQQEQLQQQKVQLEQLHQKVQHEQLQHQEHQLQRQQHLQQQNQQRRIASNDQKQLYALVPIQHESGPSSPNSIPIFENPRPTAGYVRQSTNFVQVPGIVQSTPFPPPQSQFLVEQSVLSPQSFVQSLKPLTKQRFNFNDFSTPGELAKLLPTQPKVSGYTQIQDTPQYTIYRVKDPETSTTFPPTPTPAQPIQARPVKIVPASAIGFNYRPKPEAVSKPAQVVYKSEVDPDYYNAVKTRLLSSFTKSIYPTTQPHFHNAIRPTPITKPSRPVSVAPSFAPHSHLFGRQFNPYRFRNPKPFRPSPIDFGPFYTEPLFSQGSTHHEHTVHPLRFSSKNYEIDYSPGISLPADEAAYAAVQARSLGGPAFIDPGYLTSALGNELNGHILEPFHYEASNPVPKIKSQPPQIAKTNKVELKDVDVKKHSVPPALLAQLFKSTSGDDLEFENY